MLLMLRTVRKFINNKHLKKAAEVIRMDKDKRKDLEFEELYKLCEPVLEYLHKKYDPHTEIVISMEHIRIKNDVMSIPL